MTGTSARRLLLHLAAVAAGAAAVGVALPHLMGTTWAAIGLAATAAPPLAVALLVVLWAAGLVAHTITLTGALPGLTHRRALLLSLTGSAIANVLPVGGAAGIALNQRMARGWGFSNAAFVTYTVVTNLWDVLAKSLLPVVLVPVLLLAGSSAHAAVRLLAGSAVAVPVLGLLALWTVLSPAVLPRLHRRLERWQQPRRPDAWLGRAARRVARALAAGERARASSAALARERWGRLTSGMALYTALLFALLLGCLHVTHAGVPLGVAVVAFCGERLLTLVGLTPGGLGLVELGLASALMLSPSASGVGVATAVVLYRLLTFGLEIPVGGAALAGWTWQRLRAASASTAGPTTSEGGRS
jgi:uncharacterized membrane protein YbhN (UPF0104 family)